MKHLLLIATACLAAGCTTDSDDRVDMAANDEAALAAELKRL